MATANNPHTTGSLLPRSNSTLVVRTDFSSDAAWQSITRTLPLPTGEGFTADVTFLDDLAYRDVTLAQVLERVPEDYAHCLLLICDAVTMSDPRRLILVVDLLDEPGRQFRTTSELIQRVENNLSLRNMSFTEFLNFVGDDGIFHGFDPQYFNWKRHRGES